MEKVYFITTALIACFALTACQPTIQPEASLPEGQEDLTDPAVKDPSVATIMEKLILTSSAFADQSSIPSRYTCDGEDVNPPLKITGVPPVAKSLALIVDDPDAPAGDWVHWLVWDIPTETLEIPEDSRLAGAVQGTTDFGRAEYGGPCPPAGTHRYQFKLYALDVTLGLNSSSRKKDLEKAMLGHILEQTTLVGLYARP